DAERLRAGGVREAREHERVVAGRDVERDGLTGGVCPGHQRRAGVGGDGAVAVAVGARAVDVEARERGGRHERRRIAAAHASALDGVVMAAGRDREGSEDDHLMQRHDYPVSTVPRRAEREQWASTLPSTGRRRGCFTCASSTLHHEIKYDNIIPGAITCATPLL